MLKTIKNLFNGRCTANRFFLNLCVVLLIDFILIVSFSMLTGKLPQKTQTTLALATVTPLLLYFQILFLALVVRRLHDLNKNFLWACLLLIPIVNSFFFLWLLLAKSVEPNLYGETSEKGFLSELFTGP